MKEKQLFDENIIIYKNTIKELKKEIKDNKKALTKIKHDNRRLMKEAKKEYKKKKLFHGKL